MPIDRERTFEDDTYANYQIWWGATIYTYIKFYIVYFTYGLFTVRQLYLNKGVLKYSNIFPLFKSYIFAQLKN